MSTNEVSKPENTFELNHRYTLSQPAGSISQAGIVEIVGLMHAQRLQKDEWKELNPDWPSWGLPELPDTWDWVWSVQSGEYRGKFAKRVAAYLFKQHNLRCPDKFITELGNIARPHVSDDLAYYFDFVDEFDWYAGSFGDGGSCYWGGNSGAREMLASNGGRAIRFFESASGNKGYARAWLVPVRSYYIIFNGYGLSTVTIARIFAGYMKLTYKHIWLNNNGSTSGTLWINGGQGFVVGSESDIARVERHDFGWGDECQDTCYNCGTCLDEYSAYYAPDDNSYCEHCYNDLFESCERCGEVYDSDRVSYVASERQYMCDWCREELETEQDSEESLDESQD